MKIREIEAFWRARDLPVEVDEGFRFGPRDADLSGVLVCWKPTLDAMEAASAAGCNLIITHEELNFPPVYAGGRVEDQLTGGVTLLRIQRLLELGITVFRSHSTLDRLCILDEFGKALGFGEPTIHGDYWERTYKMPAISVRDLALKIKWRLGLDTLRVAGDLNHVVRCAALPWGGVGISANPTCIQTLLALDADVLIAGEAEEIPMYAALDAGVPLIETGHSASESPGMRRFAAMLRECFPSVSVEFYQNPRSWVLA